MHTETQTNIQTHRHTNNHTYTQGLASTQTYKHTDKHNTNIHTHTSLMVAGATRPLVYHEHILSGIKLYS